MTELTVNIDDTAPPIGVWKHIGTDAHHRNNLCSSLVL